MQELNYEELDTMHEDDIDNLKVEAVKELNIEQQHTAIIEQKFLDTQLKIIGLQKEKKEYEIALSKAKSVLRTLSAQIRILESKFWSARKRK